MGFAGFGVGVWTFGSVLGFVWGFGFLGVFCVSDDGGFVGWGFGL